jgi:uncharacterized membrane protein (DUF2068 family)
MNVCHFLYIWNRYMFSTTTIYLPLAWYQLMDAVVLVRSIELSISNRQIMRTRRVLKSEK